MGWLNRLCIRQLERALPIAMERMKLARQEAERTHMFANYAYRRERVLEIGRRIDERKETELKRGMG